ncbi:MAG: hypothetical protein ACXWJX_16080 [Limisphaerales bacterium]
MRPFRVILLLLMGFVLCVMVAGPGLYDSKRRAMAHSHFAKAPSDTTRMELENAKTLDHRDIFLYELVMVSIFTIAVYAFVRSGKKVQPVA